MKPGKTLMTMAVAAATVLDGPTDGSRRRLSAAAAGNTALVVAVVAVADAAAVLAAEVPILIPSK